MLPVNYRCIIVHYRKHLWGVFHYVVLSALREVTVGYIACGRLHVAKYVFPDVLSYPPTLSLLSSRQNHTVITHFIWIPLEVRQIIADRLYAFFLYSSIPGQNGDCAYER
jgi:hypothetical protein